MCIVLLTTAHPDFALIVIDNRDEFILRPTSRPHWWTSSGSSAVTPAGSTPARASPAPEAPASSASLKPPSPPYNQDQQILASRDLQRPEHGTWLGITKAGHFAVLTNYREDTPNDAAHPIHGQRSRGGMVTAWLTADRDETTEQFVERMLADGVKDVGGFSLICGKLRKRDFTHSPGAALGPLAIISNRADQVAQVPWIAGRRGEVYGLSNASYDAPEEWPKVRDGKAALRQLAAAAAAEVAARTQKAQTAETSIEKLTTAGVPSSDALRDALFAILDRDTLPQRPHLSFEEQIPLLKHSVFIPAIGDEAHRIAMEKAVANGPRLPFDSVDSAMASAADEELVAEERPDGMGFMTGMYGTQRQTVILVDWDGNVSFTERALWDANGHAIPRGTGDVHFSFTIEGWND